MKMALLMLVFTATHSEPTTTGNPSLEDKRWTPATPLGECTGNCNDDDDCSGSLVCWDTGSNREVPVPGCSGTSTENWDYCVDSELAEEWYTPLECEYGSEDILLYECQGDCDSDDHCAGRLECLDWSNHAPPQCTPVGRASSLCSYCYDPLWGTDETGAPTSAPTGIPDGYQWLESIDYAGQIEYLLGECQGSCWKDSDCEGELACTGSTYVPGGCQGDTVEGYKYCYDPEWTDPAEEEMTFISWLDDGSQFFKLPDKLPTVDVVTVAVLLFVAFSLHRCWCWKKEQKSYKRAVFEDSMDSDTDIEVAQPLKR